MGLTKDLVSEALSGVSHPSGDDLVAAGAVKWIAACDGFASVKLSIDGFDAASLEKLGRVADATIRSAAEDAGERVEGLLIQFVDPKGKIITSIGRADDPRVSDTQTKEEQPTTGASAVLPGVRHVIAVGAGKGGVGKSTIAVSLALGLARKGHSVGLLDGDIYGPSLPTMLGLGALEQNVLEGRLQPFMVHGVKSVTIGKLVDPEKPLIWRGPMAHGAFNQLVERTSWGELDYLIVDLPPGTGDVPLTLAQSISLTGAVVVCTPQRVAQDDAVRAVKMFEQLGVDVLGVVENMSYFIGDDGKEYDIFGRGGAEMMAQRLALPFLGAVPINTSLRANLDAGQPTKNFDPGTAGGEQLPRALDGITQQLKAQVTLAAMQQGATRPTLSIS